MAELKIRAEIGKYRRAAMVVAAAAAFALAALVALSLTVVIGLAHWIGPWGGGLLAVAIFCAAAVGLGVAAKRFVERIDD